MWRGEKGQGHDELQEVVFVEAPADADGDPGEPEREHEAGARGAAHGWSDRLPRGEHPGDDRAADTERNRLRGEKERVARTARGAVMHVPGDHPVPELGKRTDLRERHDRQGPRVREAGCEREQPQYTAMDPVTKLMPAEDVTI